MFCSRQKKLQCGICNEVFNCRDELLSHAYTAHAEIKSESIDSSDLERLLKKHKCNKCFELFNSHMLFTHNCHILGIKTELDDKKNFDNLEEDNACSQSCSKKELQCFGRIFINEQGYEDHQLIKHISVSCEFCGKYFENAGYLRIHQSLKHNSKPTKYCQICNLTFKSRDNYLCHERSKHGGVRFECEICSKKLTRASNL